MSRATDLLADERRVDRIGSELFAHWASCRPAAASILGIVPERLGAPLESDHIDGATKAVKWAVELDAIRPDSLDTAGELTRRYLRFEIAKIADGPQLHALSFQITPYQLGHITAELHWYLDSYTFAHEHALDRYLELIRRYRYFVRDTLSNLREQVSREVIVSVRALPACINTVSALRASCVHHVCVSPDRLIQVPERTRRAFLDCLAQECSRLQAAFAELAAYMEGDYARRASDVVGLCRLPGGEAAYHTLIRHHTTLTWDAEAIHQRGLALVSEIEEDMAKIRAELRFRGSARDFLREVRGNPRFYCKTPEELSALFAHLVKKAEAVMPRAFGTRTFAPFGVRRLPPEAEGGMTFGYYLPAAIGGSGIGHYVFNGSALDQRSTIGAASLIYHELIPGHHLHYSTEMDNPSRPLARRFPTITVFTEGWAEYAADLGFELGLYADPYDRFGRHLLQVFLASRLVVDTGLNALGWTLERAGDYLFEHTALSSIEISSETLRYATGMPGQGLAYAPGREYLWDLRRLAEQRLGSRFRLPDFHHVILEAGSLPLPDLRFNIEQWTSRQGCGDDA